MVWKHFLPFHRLSFHSVDHFFCCTEVLRFDVVPFVYFCFCCLCFSCHIHGIIAKSNVMNLSPYIFSRSFRASGLMFRSLIHFELIFVWCKLNIKLHSFSCDSPVLQAPFVGETILSPYDHTYKVLFLCSLFCSIGLYVCFYASTILFWLL